MKSAEANRISIKQFLAARGIHPAQDKGHYGMYLSPLRTESTPSFKVDYNRNVWYDHGIGEGGSIIELVMRLERCSFSEAMGKLESSSFSFHCPESTNFTQSTLQINSVVSLQDARLISYLNSKRSIDMDIAREYCREVHYTINGKQFFAVGFQSDARGWELRNEYFKGGASPKGITTIGSSSPTCMLFEGFIDMLSYLTLKQTIKPSVDMVVLNSVVNLGKAIPFLSEHSTVHAFLDNDDAGRRTVEQLRHCLSGCDIVDQSVFYRDHKDLNEYLCGKKLENKFSNNQVSNQVNEPPKPTPKPARRMKL